MIVHVRFNPLCLKAKEFPRGKDIDKSFLAYRPERLPHSLLVGAINSENFEVFDIAEIETFSVRHLPMSREEAADFLTKWIRLHWGWEDHVPMPDSLHWHTVLSLLVSLSAKASGR